MSQIQTTRWLDKVYDFKRCWRYTPPISEIHAWWGGFFIRGAVSFYPLGWWTNSWIMVGFPIDGLTWWCIFFTRVIGILWCNGNFRSRPREYWLGPGTRTISYRNGDTLCLGTLPRLSTLIRLFKVKRDFYWVYILPTPVARKLECVIYRFLCLAVILILWTKAGYQILIQNLLFQTSGGNYSGCWKV